MEDVEGVRSELTRPRTLPLLDCAKTAPATIVTITITRKADTEICG